MPIRFAGFWVRLFADIIDTSILTIVSWIIEYLLIVLFYVFHYLWSGNELSLNFPHFTEALSSIGLQILNAGIYFSMAFPYYTIAHFQYGTTLGKRLFKIRVVQFSDNLVNPPLVAEGGFSFSPINSITMKQSVLRFLGFGLSYITLGTGYLMVLFHPEKRALHELISGTCSVRFKTYTGPKEY